MLDLQMLYSNQVLQNAVCRSVGNVDFDQIAIRRRLTISNGIVGCRIGSTAWL
jgi:hypothetical protein